MAKIAKAFHLDPKIAKQSEIQSLIFPKDKFTRAQAKKWAQTNGFKSSKIDETSTSFRLRQADPGKFKRFRNKELPSSGGVIGVIAVTKEFLAEAVERLIKEEQLPTELLKGFPLGIAEAGIHVHNLERENEATKLDGRHRHLYMLPNGDLILTEEDGEHSHILDKDTSDNSEVDGVHGHRIILPDGKEVFTKENGIHGHQLQVASSAFDGVHRHQLELPEGTIIWSFLAGDFWAQQGKPNQAGNPKAPPTSVLQKDAKKKVEDLEDEPLEDYKVLALAALGYEIKDIDKEDEPDPEVINKMNDLIGDKEVPIFKTDDEKRLVYGVVLEPEVVDAQKDIMSKEAIEETAHFFMKNSRVIGLGHTKKSGAVPVESYIAPVTFTTKEGPYGGQTVKKGSWVLGVNVPGDKEWGMVKKGDVQAFSIGGFGKRSPESSTKA